MRGGLVGILVASMALSLNGCSKKDKVVEGASNSAEQAPHFNGGAEVKVPKAVILTGNEEVSDVSFHSDKLSADYFVKSHFFLSVSSRANYFADFSVLPAENSSVGSGESLWDRGRSSYYIISSRPLPDMRLTEQEGVQIDFVTKHFEAVRSAPSKDETYTKETKADCSPGDIKEVSGGEKKKILEMVRESSPYVRDYFEDPSVYRIPLDSPVASTNSDVTRFDGMNFMFSLDKEKFFDEHGLKIANCYLFNLRNSGGDSREDVLFLSETVIQPGYIRSLKGKWFNPQETLMFEMREDGIVIADRSKPRGRLVTRYRYDEKSRELLFDGGIFSVGKDGNSLTHIVRNEDAEQKIPMMRSSN